MCTRFSAVFRGALYSPLTAKSTFRCFFRASFVLSASDNVAYLIPPHKLHLDLPFWANADLANYWAFTG